jgi:RNA polymerase sigma-70 factor (ECF subfamily)
VCRNRAVDVNRKEGRVRPLEGEALELPASPPVEAAPDSRETGSRLMRALHLLTPNQQEVIRLKFQHGLKYKEIAAVTDLSVTNVGFLIHTGLKKMREALGETP